MRTRHQPPARVRPIPTRLGAQSPLGGRGVTIAFLDSGFYAHPDLVEPEDRILECVDVSGPAVAPLDPHRVDESSWHGLMTSVVACGNGRLSNGRWRGLAPHARLVLVKVGSARRITHDAIRRGLDWVRENRARLGVRVVNVSCGGDWEASYLDDPLSVAAERATQAGLLVVAAVGNTGHRPDHPVFPPASAPSVLAVGGIDDGERDDLGDTGMYHGGWGPTVDGLQKPDLLAPGIWLAAPLLPGTPTAAEVHLLHDLDACPDEELGARIRARPGASPVLDAAATLPPYLVREAVTARLADEKVICRAYKHVDGTSFAAPIVASLAAAMLEACPGLGPLELKRCLMRTARRVPGVDPSRQGFGVIRARAALHEAERLGAAAPPRSVPQP